MSGAFAASRVPTMVIMEDNASLKLFTASKVMAMEPVTIPTKALKPDKSTLAIIPITDVRIMATMRLATCSFVSMVKPPQVNEL